MRKNILSIAWAFLLLFPATGSVAAPRNLTFWTMEVEAERLEIQMEIARSFQEKTGIAVSVVPVEENRMAERMASAMKAGAVPDVVFLPIDLAVGWAKGGVLDARCASEVVRRLGEETFGSPALNLVRSKGRYSAIPVDGWGQFLLYRKDLFEKAGLPVPDRWERILSAAETLHQPPLIWGFEAPNDPDQIYTQQVFEHFALSNGVRLTGRSGRIELNTPAMVEVLRFYRALHRYTPPGRLYWLHTRMDYLTGRAAMTVWSSFILDELSGLRRDKPVVPDLARGEPGYLARNTGFVPVLRGPRGAAHYGQINYLGITKAADREAAMRWAVFLLSDRYLRWLSMAPEGKLPLRKGTSEDPDLFIRQWRGLEFGVTTRAKISDFYGLEVVRGMAEGVERFDRWGFSEGKSALVSKIYAEKIVPKILKRFLDGEFDAERAASVMQKRVEALVR